MLLVVRLWKKEYSAQAPNVRPCARRSWVFNCPVRRIGAFIAPARRRRTRKFRAARRRSACRSSRCAAMRSYRAPRRTAAHTEILGSARRALLGLLLAGLVWGSLAHILCGSSDALGSMAVLSCRARPTQGEACFTVSLFQSMFCSIHSLSCVKQH